MYSTDSPVLDALWLLFAFVLFPIIYSYALALASAHSDRSVYLVGWLAGGLAYTIVVSLRVLRRGWSGSDETATGIVFAIGALATVGIVGVGGATLALRHYARRMPDHRLSVTLGTVLRGLAGYRVALFAASLLVRLGWQE